MGLNHPSDLSAWHSWQHSRNRLRTLKAAVRRPSVVDLVLLCGAVEPTVLVALDAVTPSALAAVLRPAQHLQRERVAVLAPRAVAERLVRERWWSVTIDPVDAPLLTSVDPLGAVPRAVCGVKAVLSAGHFLTAGALAYRWSELIGATYCVAQHGLLTPFAPPLPRDATLFAFSEADGHFWRSGRGDVTTESVGSQLLWDAAAAQRGQIDDSARPVFLGQLHGAELPRKVSAATASAFCRETGASYRPHPAENDRLSRFQHRAWEKQGIEVETNSTHLSPGRPVVAVFSTGVLESAASGAHAWVTCVNAPAWVSEFWQRYELSQWGGDPTPPPGQPHTEPSRQIAEHIQKLVQQ